MENSGTLFIVATPIGNVADLSGRAAEVLAGVQLIACEDTRRTGNLLQLAGVDLQLSPSTGEPAAEAVKRRLLACHEHNEEQVTPYLLDQLLAGIDVALVSDAGTPLVSDPGFRLVQQAHARGVSVRPIPGASAVQALLSVCPLPAERFRFEGFLPSRAGKRRSRLEQVLASSELVVFFEAPHRILATLNEVASLAPERQVFLGREITKKYEAFYQGTAAEVAAALEATDAVRGEFAFAVAGVAGMAASGVDEVRLRRALETLAVMVGPSKAAKVLAQLTGRPRSELYDLAPKGSAGRPSQGALDLNESN